MHHKKTVTDAVRAANRANSKFSPGPTTKEGKSHSSRNAVRHGILARKVVLDTHRQRAEFRELLQDCDTEFRPKGLCEKFFVEEIATLFWKLGITEFLEVRELLRRQDLSDNVASILHNNPELPIIGDDLPLNRGWDCERMVVRGTAGTDQHNSTAMSGPALIQNQLVPTIKSSQSSGHQKVDHIEIEAVMGRALENITRYQAKLKRALYHAIEALRKRQAERREGDE
jgi:hypothetical protein